MLVDPELNFIMKVKKKKITFFFGLQNKKILPIIFQKLFLNYF